ncbi:sugar phosphate isomerase/epimerase [Candidatus Sumerlaeota bacterium]|nr:sugar phosphate isomerase/epimerase [Candidatus Sumerlaeota bacterium]
MKIEQVAAITYTIRDFIKDREGVVESLKKLRKIGYQAVQISGMAAKIDPTELADIIEGEGLVCCATHEPGVELIERPEQVAAKLNALRCKYTAYPWPHNMDLFKSEEGVKFMCEKLENTGRVLKDAGIVFTYHNHNVEFVRIGGKLVLEHFYDETDPVLVQGELDTYWVQHGGGNPVSWIQRLNNRLPLLHMKDYQTTIEHKATYAEIGQGNLEWDKIIPAAEAAGCKWFIVEQDTCPGDPFDSLKISFDYIKENLVE